MVVLNDEQDYWERRGAKWFRHHLQPHRTLFIPKDGPEHPPTSTLEPYRTTHAINIQTDEVSQVKDERTTTDMPTELQYTWKGTTTFTLKDEFDSTIEDVKAPPAKQPDPLQEARRERGGGHPTQPTKQEMEERALTHMPYSSWCPICVKPSNQKANKMPTSNSIQDSQSYRLTLHTWRHQQTRQAWQYLQQLMYSHNCAWH